MLRLNQTWSNYLTAGFFKTLSGLETLPWSTDTEVTTEELDFQYHLNYSGRKITSPAVDALLDAATTYTGVLTSADKTTLCNAVWGLYHKKWAKLWATLNFTYNPIENYNRTETKTGTETGTQTPTNWKETVTETPDSWAETVQGSEADNAATTNTSKYGFDSSVAVPDGVSTTTAKNKQTTTKTGTYETETSRTGTYQNEMEYDTEVNVSGNIGVTTSQQMVEEERKVWMWDFFSEVFSDVDHVLTISIY